MAMTFQSDIDHLSGSTGSTTSTVTGITWDAAWEYVLMHVAGVPNVTNTTAMSLTAASVSDGTNTLTLAIPAGGTNFQTYSLPTAASYFAAIAHARCSDATPGALSTSAGACTLTMTWSRAVGAHAAGIVGLNMGTSASSPFRALEYITSTDANVASITHASMAVEQDGVAIICQWNSGSGNSFAQSSGFTERADISVVSRRYGFQTLDIGSNQNLAPVIDPASDARINSYLVWFKEVNDAALTSAATAPFEPGETVTLTGTGLDASGAGARIRKVGGTLAYDDLTGFADTSSTAATATIPNRPSRTPYTTASHTVEFIALKSGGGTSGTPTPAYALNPPTGFSVVEISAPDLTSQSLLSYLGWTSVAGDQIEWDNSVNVSGTDVAVTVNADGTIALDSTPNPMPATVTFKWRAYSTADEDWTGQASDLSDWATATVTDGAIEPGASISSYRPLQLQLQMRI